MIEARDVPISLSGRVKAANSRGRTMSNATLNERLTALEREVAELKALLTTGDRPKDWRRTVGMFTDDEGMQELFAEAMKLREKDRARARRRNKSVARKQR